MHDSVIRKGIARGPFICEVLIDSTMSAFESLSHGCRLSISSVYGIKLQSVHVTTVFNFTRPLGIFHQEKTVFRLPSIIPYMVRRQNFSHRSKGFCVFKISVIVHNRYCVKCSRSYTADYTGTCPKSPVIFWLIRR